MLPEKSLQFAIRNFARTILNTASDGVVLSRHRRQSPLQYVAMDRYFSSSAQSTDEKKRIETRTSKSRPFSSALPPTKHNKFSLRKRPALAVNSAAVYHVEEDREHQRIWMPHSLEEPLFWSDDVVNGTQSDPHDLAKLLERIEKQEQEGGRMKSKQSGVLHEDPAVDMRLLTENYTVTSLASALRDREDALQHCAQLALENKLEELQAYLKMFHPDMVLTRRNQKRQLDVSKPLNGTSLEIIRKALMRMPRRVVQAHSRRAGVVIPIVHVDGVPSLLLEKRSPDLRAHPDEVCLPVAWCVPWPIRRLLRPAYENSRKKSGDLILTTIKTRGWGLMASACSVFCDATGEKSTTWLGSPLLLLSATLVKTWLRST